MSALPPRADITGENLDRSLKADIGDATRRIAFRMAEATLPNKRPVGATAVPAQNRPTNREDCHAKCDPEFGSPSIAERVTVFGQLEVLFEKVWMRSTKI